MEETDRKGGQAGNMLKAQYTLEWECDYEPRSMGHGCTLIKTMTWTQDRGRRVWTQRKQNGGGHSGIRQRRIEEDEGRVLYTWMKCHDETHYFTQLINANKKQSQSSRHKTTLQNYFYTASSSFRYLSGNFLVLQKRIKSPLCSHSCLPLSEYDIESYNQKLPHAHRNCLYFCNLTMQMKPHAFLSTQAWSARIPMHPVDKWLTLEAVETLLSNLHIYRSQDASQSYRFWCTVRGLEKTK